MSEENKDKQIKIQIDLDEITAQGIYSNLASISHTESEFTMDFIYLQPQAPKAKVRNRVIISPGHAKRFFQALEDNIKKYEKQFGSIKTVGNGGKKIGF
ncbi:DUF3467 domain-containing protein [bacterium]|nr:DUF3467 domain-containing protein [bacterium]